MERGRYGMLVGAVMGVMLIGAMPVAMSETLGSAGVPPSPMDLAPGVPTLTSVRVVGACRSIAELEWSLSADDGAGENDIAAYDVYTGSTYDPTGASYYLFTSLPPGTTTTLHPPSGCGIPGIPVFYVVKARDTSGQTAPASDQGAKISQSVGAFTGPGKALVSVPLEQADWSVGTVLGSVTWSRARTYGAPADQAHGWHAYDSGRARGDLARLDRTMGVWLQLDGSNFFWQAGIVPRVTQITLQPGWNLVGYSSFAERTVADVLAGIDYLAVEGYTDDSAYGLRRMGPAEPMVAGQGYWIHVRQADVLTLTN